MRKQHDKVCSICGSQFKTIKPKQKTCSPECGRKQGHETMKKYFLCRHCGKPFWRENAFRMKYCGTDCRMAVRHLEVEERKKQNPAKEAVIYNRICPICNKEFSTVYPSHIYCSHGCGYEGMLLNRREQWAEQYTPRIFSCRECGFQVTTSCGDTRSSFCSDDCLNRFVKRTGKQVRNELMKQAYRTSVSFEKIYHRDGGVCKICGLPVAHDKSPEKIWSATIDHIVPLSTGGIHHPDNCQLAHRLCNSMKLQEKDGYQIDWDALISHDPIRWSAYLYEYRMYMSEHGGIPV